MKIVGLDTETTSKEDGSKSIVELGMVALEFEDDSFIVLDSLSVYEKRFKPREAITFGAMGVHHITEADVADCNDISEHVGEIHAKLDEADLVIGHNLKFDMEVVEREILGGPFNFDKKVDSLRLARHAWNDLSEYNLSALRYRFDLPVLEAGSQHSAAFDAFLSLQLAWNAGIMMGLKNWLDVFRKSITPITIKKMYFGKYRGEVLEDVFEKDKGYFRWLRKQPWFAEEHSDLMYTLTALGEKQKGAKDAT